MCYFRLCFCGMELPIQQISDIKVRCWDFGTDLLARLNIEIFLIGTLLMAILGEIKYNIDFVFLWIIYHLFIGMDYLVTFKKCRITCSLSRTIDGLLTCGTNKTDCVIQKKIHVNNGKMYWKIKDHSVHSTLRIATVPLTQPLLMYCESCGVI